LEVKGALLQNFSPARFGVCIRQDG
jgi:hypothetical protein